MDEEQGLDLHVVRQRFAQAAEDLEKIGLDATRLQASSERLDEGRLTMEAIGKEIVAMTDALLPVVSGIGEGVETLAAVDPTAIHDGVESNAKGLKKVRGELAVLVSGQAESKAALKQLRILVLVVLVGVLVAAVIGVLALGG